MKITKADLIKAICDGKVGSPKKDKTDIIDACCFGDYGYVYYHTLQVNDHPLTSKTNPYLDFRAVCEFEIDDDGTIEVSDAAICAGYVETIDTVDMKIDEQELAGAYRIHELYGYEDAYPECIVKEAE